MVNLAIRLNVLEDSYLAQKKLEIAFRDIRTFTSRFTPRKAKVARVEEIRTLPNNRFRPLKGLFILWYQSGLRYYPLVLAD